MGAGFGALLHNTAAAIVLFFVLPTVWGVLAFGVFERLAPGRSAARENGRTAVAVPGRSSPARFVVSGSRKSEPAGSEPRSRWTGSVRAGSPARRER